MRDTQRTCRLISSSMGGACWSFFAVATTTACLLRRHNMVGSCEGSTILFPSASNGKGYVLERLPADATCVHLHVWRGKRK